jgi:hypothetical protein
LDELSSVNFIIKQLYLHMLVHPQPHKIREVEHPQIGNADTVSNSRMGSEKIRSAGSKHIKIM